MGHPPSERARLPATQFDGMAESFDESLCVLWRAKTDPQRCNIFRRVFFIAEVAVCTLFCIAFAFNVVTHPLPSRAFCLPPGLLKYENRLASRRSDFHMYLRHCISCS